MGEDHRLAGHLQQGAVQAHPAAGFGSVALEDGAVEADQGVVGHVGIVGKARLKFGFEVDGFRLGLVLTAPAFGGGAVAQGRDAHAIAVADHGGRLPRQIVGPGAGPGGVGSAVMAGAGGGPFTLCEDAGAFVIDQGAVGVIAGPVVGPVAAFGVVGVVRVHGVLPVSQPASVRGWPGRAGRTVRETVEALKGLGNRAAAMMTDALDPTSTRLKKEVHHKDHKEGTEDTKGVEVGLDAVVFFVNPSWPL